jgi:hypothetical protein
MNYIIPAIELLIQEFLDGFTNFLAGMLNIEKIKFSIFIIALLFSFIFIWNPYLKNLNMKIWRTKGMLNMIPMNIIIKYESLKEAFLKSQDIMNAVK